jgi:hypothetical protein
MKLTINRLASIDRFGILARFVLEDGGDTVLTGYTVELAYRGNRQGESAIPEGTYTAGFYESERFGRTVLLLEGVPGRTYIEIHPANAPHQLDGCIAPGETYGWAQDYEAWADRDEFAVWNSAATMDAILDAMDERGVSDLTVAVRAAPLRM